MDYAVDAEKLGFHSVWMVDHLQPVLDHAGPHFECWTAMAALATATSRVRLGQVVTCNGYRSPALLAKMAACVDAMSGGRLDLGIGAGWDEAEARAWGFDVPPTAGARIARLAEAVDLILALWANEPTYFAGEHYRTDGAQMAPRCAQDPHVPLWIGGQGVRRTLPLAAERGDWCNITGSPENVARKRDVVLEHCAKIGRDASSISVSWTGDIVIAETEAEVNRHANRFAQFWAARGFPQYADPAHFRDAHIVGTPDQVRERIAAYRAAGCDHFIVEFWDLGRPARELFADTVLGDGP